MRICNLCTDKGSPILPTTRKKARRRKSCDDIELECRISLGCCVRTASKISGFSVGALGGLAVGISLSTMYVGSSLVGDCKGLPVGSRQFSANDCWPIHYTTGGIVSSCMCMGGFLGSYVGETFANVFCISPICLRAKEL